MLSMARDAIAAVRTVKLRRKSQGGSTLPGVACEPSKLTSRPQIGGESSHIICSVAATVARQEPPIDGIERGHFRMDHYVFSAFVFVLILSSAGLGSYVRSRLADHHFEEASLAAMRIAVGLVATLSALVLSLLISSECVTMRWNFGTRYSLADGLHSNTERA
jgi:hypothetical protein